MGKRLTLALGIALLVCGSRLMSQEPVIEPPKPVEAPQVDAAKAEPAKPQPAKAEDNDAAPDKDPRAADPAAGHSYHGAEYNEGPRQKAYLMEGTGNVNLPVTSDVPDVQKFINQGVGQLHGFWYFEAERSFRQAAALDPKCAMAYWGMAMANFDNANRAKPFITKAVGLKGGASRREQLWIDGFNGYFQSTAEGKVKWRELIRRLENICYEFPDELEAKAFLAWTIWSGDRGGLPHTSHMALDALIGDVLQVNPMHPVHHYRIHLWDYEKTERAVASAALCGQAAPGVAHMWHMSGHIFWRLARYHESAWQQEASSRVDHAFMIRDRVMPYQIHNYAHNQEWLTRSLSHVGRVRDAVDLAKNLIELPQHPKHNVVSNRGSSAYFGRSRLMDQLERFELWNEAIALSQTPYLEPTDDAEEQAKRLRLLGAAYVETAQHDKAREILVDLDARLAKLEQEQTDAIAQAEKKAMDEKKNEEDTKKAVEAAKNPFANRRRPVELAQNEIRLRLAFAEGRHEEGLQLIAKVSDLSKEQQSLFQLAAGKLEEAEKLAQQAKQSGNNQMPPLANLAYVLYRCDKLDQAKVAFEQLRKEGGTCDLESPVFARLAPLAKELGCTSDWRIARPVPPDAGVHPSLDSLGPFRWHPAAAPEWTLPSIDGSNLSSKGFEGKPVVVIFYLGHGCLHCVEQLKKFGPMAAKYREAGIELVAISTDSPVDLQKSADAFRTGPEGEAIPFPLAADPQMAVFRQYRAFDDFESQPLHGTFLIDQDGLVRWQDVSYEPFMDAEFLLKESQRLLSLGK